MKIDEIERMKARLSTIAESSESYRDKGARSDVVLMLFVEGLKAHLPQDLQAHVQEILRLHERCWSSSQQSLLASRGGSGEEL
jgi:hypothetical protein